MTNICVMVGRLTKDPIVKTTGNQKSVANFSLAVDRDRKVEGQPTADFFNVVVWGASATACGNYLHKGSLVCVSGTLQTRSYDKDGHKNYVTEIIAEKVDFLEPKAKNQPQQGQPQYQQQAPAPQYQQPMQPQYQAPQYQQPTGYQQPQYQQPYPNQYMDFGSGQQI